MPGLDLDAIKRLTDLLNGKADPTTLGGKFSSLNQVAAQQPQQPIQSGNLASNPNLLDRLGDFLLPATKRAFTGIGQGKSNLGDILKAGAEGASYLIPFGGEAGLAGKALGKLAPAEEGAAQQSLYRVLGLNAAKDFGVNGATQSARNLGVRSIEAANAARPAAEAVAQTAPGFISKFLAPGAAVGALQGASQPDASLQSVGVNAGLGAAGAGILGPLLGKLTGLGKGAEAAATEGVANKTAARTYAKAFNIPAKMVPILKPDETFGEILQHGPNFTGNLDKITANAEKVTGQNGVLSNIARNVVGNVGEIKAPNIADNIEGALQRAVELSDKEKKTISKSIFKMVNPGSKPDTINALDTLDNIRLLEQTGHKYLNSSSAILPNLKYEQTGRVYLDAAAALKDALETGVKGTNTLAQMQTPETITAISQISPRLGKQFAQAKTLADLRAIQAPFVKLQQMAGITQNAEQAGSHANISGRIGGGIVGGSLGGIPGAVAGAAIEPLVGSVGNAAKAPFFTSMAGLLNNGSGMGIPQVTSNPAVQQGGQQALARLLPALFAGQAPDESKNNNGYNSLNETQHNANTVPEGINTVNTPQQQTPASQSVTGYTVQQLGDAYKKALLSNDTKSATQLKSLYDMENAHAKDVASAKPELSTAAQARHDNLQTALSSLDAAETNLVTAGGARGVLGNLATIPGLGQYLDAPGAAYHSTKIELATQLAKAITNSSRPAESVIRKYEASLPDVNENPKFVAEKLKKIRSELLTQAKSFSFNDLLDSYNQ